MKTTKIFVVTENLVDKYTTTLISGFRRDVGEICGLLGNYTASYGNYLPTFRDNVSVPSSRVNFNYNL
jgi:hypothetical protein